MHHTYIRAATIAEALISHHEAMSTGLLSQYVSVEGQTTDRYLDRIAVACSAVPAAVTAETGVMHIPNLAAFVIRPGQPLVPPEVLAFDYAPHRGWLSDAVTYRAVDRHLALQQAEKERRPLLDVIREILREADERIAQAVRDDDRGVSGSTQNGARPSDLTS